MIGHIDENLKNDAITLLEVANDIEKRMWNKYGLKDFNEGRKDREYRTKSLSITSNLNDPKNPELRHKVLSGLIKPNQLIEMNSMELAPKQLQEQRKERKEKYFKEKVLLSSDVHNSKRLIKLKDKEIILDPMKIEEPINVEEEFSNSKMPTRSISPPCATMVINKVKDENKEIEWKRMKEQIKVEFITRKLQERYRNIIGGDSGEIFVDKVNEYATKL